MVYVHSQSSLTSFSLATVCYLHSDFSIGMKVQKDPKKSGRSAEDNTGNIEMQGCGVQSKVKYWLGLPNAVMKSNPEPHLTSPYTPFSIQSQYSLSTVYSTVSVQP